MKDVSLSGFHDTNFRHFVFWPEAKTSISGVPNVFTIFWKANSFNSHSMSMFFCRDSMSAITLSFDAIYEVINIILRSSAHSQISLAKLL